MSSARRARPALALIVISWFALAAAALAAHPRAGAFYGGTFRQGGGFQVSRDGKTMTFRAKAVVGVTCGPTTPPTGPVVGQFNLSSRSVPKLKIRSDGSFRGARNEGTVSVRITGHFFGTGSAMVFSVVTNGGGLGRCSSAKYTLHSSHRRAKHHKHHK
jgi:hypothetical protein